MRFSICFSMYFHEKLDYFILHVSLFIEYRVKIILKEKSIKEEKLSSSDLFRRLIGYFQQARSQVSPKEGGRGGGGGDNSF